MKPSDIAFDGLGIPEPVYTNMGKITVMAGLIEARMKTLPQLIAYGDNRRSAWPITATMNVSALCAISQAAIRSEFAQPTDGGCNFFQHFIQAVGDAKAAYSKRSHVVHSTFLPAKEEGDKTRVTGVRMQISRGIQVSHQDFSESETIEILHSLRDAFDNLEACVQVMHLLRGKRGFPRRTSHILTLYQKTHPNTRQQQRERFPDGIYTGHPT